MKCIEEKIRRYSPYRLPRAGGRQMGALLQNRFRVSIWDDGNGFGNRQ